MKKLFLYVIVSCSIMSCTKEFENTSIKDVASQQKASIEEADCEYIIQNSPTPIIDLLKNPDDPQEEVLDIYLYHIARAYVNYSCETANLHRDYQEFEFSRYTDVNGQPEPDTEVEIEDLYNGNAIFKRALDMELASVNLNWNTIKGQFTWHGYTYIPSIYLENGAVADWSLPPLVGIGTDVDADDQIADFIPVFSKDCEDERSDIIEGILWKVDYQEVQAQGDGLVNYTSQCLKNPILIVQLGWSKNKKSKDLGDPKQFSGTTIDNPPFPPPTPSCNIAEEYYLKLGTLGGHRYERGRRSEYNLEIYTLEVGSGNILYHIDYVSRRERLRKVKKKDRNKVLGLNQRFTPTLYSGVFRKPTQFFVGPGHPKAPKGYNVYAATYEYDWYAKNRNLTFDNYRGYTPTLRLKRKGDHEHYQIMTLTPPDWCENERRKFTDKISHSEVEAK